MMKILYFVLAMVMLLSFACDSVPTEPAPEPVDQPNYAEVYKDFDPLEFIDLRVVSKIVRHKITEAEALETFYTVRSAQYQLMPDDWVPDGTTMTDDELIIYFSYHMAVSWMGGVTHEMFCQLYDYLHACYTEANGVWPPPFTYMRGFVWIMEANHWDVEDAGPGAPPEVPC